MTHSDESGASAGALAHEGPAIAGINIASLLNTTAPTVKCILLHTNGETSEASLDMTPKVGAVAATLGGPVSFVGQWPSLNIMIVCLRDQGNSKRNSHVLPAPFGAEVNAGDLLLIRVAEDSSNEDLSLEEWEGLLRQPAKLWEDMDMEVQEAQRYASADDDDDDDDVEEEEEEEEEDEEDEEEDEEEEDEEEGAMIAMLIGKVVEKFQQEAGREPTEEELENIITQFTAQQPHLAAAMMMATEEEEGESAAGSSSGSAADATACPDEGAAAATTMTNSDEDAAMSDVLVKVVSDFTASHGREPTADEVKDALRAMAAAASEEDAASASSSASTLPLPPPPAAAGGDGGAADAAAVGEELEEVSADAILQQLCEEFKARNGREATEDEVKQWVATLQEANVGL